MFRGTRLATAITRTLTFSEFDHVGIVIRLDGEEDIHFIEATGGPGVRVNRWDNLKNHIGIGKFYERVVFRHVNFDRSLVSMHKFCQFA